MSFCAAELFYLVARHAKHRRICTAVHNMNNRKTHVTANWMFWVKSERSDLVTPCTDGTFCMTVRLLCFGLRNVVMRSGNIPWTWFMTEIITGSPSARITSFTVAHGVHELFNSSRSILGPRFPRHRTDSDQVCLSPSTIARFAPNSDSASPHSCSPLWKHLRFVSFDACWASRCLGAFAGHEGSIRTTAASECVGKHMALTLWIALRVRSISCRVR